MEFFCWNYSNHHYHCLINCRQKYTKDLTIYNYFLQNYLVKCFLLVTNSIKNFFGNQIAEVNFFLCMLYWDFIRFIWFWLSEIVNHEMNILNFFTIAYKIYFDKVQVSFYNWLHWEHITVKFIIIFIFEFLF